MLEIGTPAPDFTLPDQNGAPHSLSDYRGQRVILYFYPKDNTAGCTKQACNFGELYPQFREAGAEIVGVSKDKVELQKKFADTQGLDFPLIADTDTTLLQQLGCWGEKVACGRKTIGILRTTYLVSEQGIIEKVFQPKEIKTRNHAEQILKWINER
jgi:peroxiredoxin Q/BCP